MKLLQFASCLAGAMLAFNLAAQTNTGNTVAVKVQDASGKPVAGATVEFYSSDEGGSELNLLPEKPKSETTDSAGLAKISAKATLGHVVARKTGMAIAASYCRPSDSQPIELTLNPATSISGVVLDESNKPVPDAKVWVSYICFIHQGGQRYSYLRTQSNEDLLSARTGTDGRFRIDGVPTEGAVDLALRKSGKAPVLSTRENTGPNTMTARAGNQNVELRMQPSGTIQGKLVIPEEGRKSQIDLVLVNEPQNATGAWTLRTRPAADGSFRFEDVAAGKYHILASFGTNKLPEWVAQYQTTTVEAGKVTRDLTITAVKGGVLEVAVFSTAEHKPIEGATVYASGVGSLNAGTVTGATGENGSGLMRLRPGQYRISGYKDGYQATSTTVQVDEGRTNRVELKMGQPPQLSGTVRDTNGAPAAGLEVRFYPQWGGNSTPKTDTNGHFQMPISYIGANARATPYVMVRDRARNLAAACDIDEGTNQCELQLAPALVVSGRVQDEQGKPLTNAVVTIIAWGGNTGWHIDSDRPPKIDAQGRYEIGTLPVGRRYSVHVSAKGHGSAYSKHEEPDTTRFEFETITLRVADQKIAGVVTDAGNNPVKRANISIYGDGQPNTSAQTDDQGRFSIDEVCDGIVNVNASASINGNYSSGNARVQAGDTNIIVVLGQQNASTQSQPRRATLVGKPLPDLAFAGIPSDALQTNKPQLICLFDPEQRPSRRIIRLLGEQNDSLKQKGVTVVGISAALITADALKEWKQSNPQPFPVGGVNEKNDKTKWILNTEKFPWLILTDAQGRVKAEGFDLDELDLKLK